MGYKSRNHFCTGLKECLSGCRCQSCLRAEKEKKEEESKKLEEQIVQQIIIGD